MNTLFPNKLPDVGLHLEGEKRSAVIISTGPHPWLLQSVVVPNMQKYLFNQVKRLGPIYRLARLQSQVLTVYPHTAD